MGVTRWGAGVTRVGFSPCLRRSGSHATLAFFSARGDDRGVIAPRRNSRIEPGHRRVAGVGSAAGAVKADLRYPRCIAGKRACPPEDCGGPWDYAEFLEAIRDPKHERHEELPEWV